MWKSKFLDDNIKVVLGLLVLGIILLLISECLPDSIFKNMINQIALAILISGILGLINEYILKKSLVDLILDKIQIKSDVDNTGIESILTKITEINYKLYFKQATKNIDIVHIYGRTWTNNHIDEIMERVKTAKCKVRVVLVSPNSSFVPALEKHFDYEEGKLGELIEEVTDVWRKQYNKIEDISKKDTRKSKKKKLGTIELYYHEGQPTNSIYRIDDKIIVIQTKSSKEKTTKLPAIIFKNTKNNDCIFKIYQNEINTLIKESQKVDLSTK